MCGQIASKSIIENTFGVKSFLHKTLKHKVCLFSLITGCFFQDFEIYSGLWSLSVSPRCQCVYTIAGQTPALQENLQSLEKSQNFKKKNTIFNEHPVTVIADGQGNL